jgi:hypothetical protein
MTTLPENIIEKLIQIEAGIHYFESPEPGQMPFVVIERESPVILSAPHGAMTFRNNHTESWHEEDEYTAGMALLLSEICNTSVMQPPGGRKTLTRMSMTKVDLFTSRNFAAWLRLSLPAG